MTVFKCFFRVARRYIGSVALYVGIMVLVSSLITASMPANSDELTVNTTDYKIAIVNQDGDDPVSAALIAFLAGKTNVQQLGAAERDTQQALFWREVEYVVRVPQGFGQSVLKGENPKLVGVVTPNDYVHMYVDGFVNRFLATLSTYHALLPEAPLETLLKRTGDDLADEVHITRVETDGTKGAMVDMGWYFRYVSYSLLAAVSSGMGMVLARLMDKRLQFRNRASSLSDTSRNVQLVLASWLYSSLIWLVLVAFGANISDVTPADMVSTPFLMMAGASYLYMGVCMGISLLITAFTQSTQVITGVSNVVSLGSSFLGGVFVPVEFLGPGVSAIGKALPAYWYTAGIRAVTEATDLGTRVPPGYLNSMGILALMMCVLLAAGMLVQRMRRQRGI